MSKVGKKFVRWFKDVWETFKRRPLLFLVIGIIQISVYVAIGYGIYSICCGNYVPAICCGAYVGGFIALCRAAATACNRRAVRRIAAEIRENLNNGNYASASL